MDKYENTRWITLLYEYKCYCISIIIRIWEVWGLKSVMVNSHEELWRRGVVARGARLAEPGAGPRAREFLALEFVGVPLPRQPVDLRL